MQTGSLLSYKTGNKKSSELPLLRQQAETFRKGDIFLGDKGFCSFYDINNFKLRGVDSVITLARRTPATDETAIKNLGDNDYLVTWKKPVWSKKSSYSKDDRQRLPDELMLRQIKVGVKQSGFRTKSFYITTTLLNSEHYPAQLYFQRRDVELFFKDIKDTMKMDVLRCKTPSMVRKEIAIFFIAYNCIRQVICAAAKLSKTKVRRLSFKGSVQAIRQWEPLLNQRKASHGQQREMVDSLYRVIAEMNVPERPGRSEPRCVKRRPKPYQLMTRLRAEMRPSAHRGRECEKAA